MQKLYGFTLIPDDERINPTRKDLREILNAKPPVYFNIDRYKWKHKIVSTKSLINKLKECSLLELKESNVSFVIVNYYDRQELKNNEYVSEDYEVMIAYLSSSLTYKHIFHQTVEFHREEINILNEPDYVVASLIYIYFKPISRLF